MSTFSPKLDIRSGLRFVLLAQLAIAGFLIASDVIDFASLRWRSDTDVPTGPITPGDQTRIYRTDKPTPSLVKFDEAPELPMPETFADRIVLSEHLVENFGTVLLISGAIAEGDAQRVRRHFDDLETEPDLAALHSPGGLVNEALEIGRFLRENEVSTAVLAGGFCVSSCPYLLAGGTERSVSKRSVVGLHQHYYETPKLLPVFLAVEGIQSGQGETMEFLIEMGVNPSIMVYALKTPPEQIYALIEKELIETRLATRTIK